MHNGLDVENAHLIRVLDQNEKSKYVALLVMMQSASHPDGAETVVLAEKSSFELCNNMRDILGIHPNDQKSVEIQSIEHNDIYYRFIVSHNGTASIKFQVVHPATPKHVAKYTKQERYFVTETPEIYKAIVEPYLNGNAASRLQWVQNILQEKSEVESMIYVDRDPINGFYLLFDSKWDRRNVFGLYLLAIGKNPAIRSLRDLDGSHLQLLKNIKRAANEVVPVTFPEIKPSQLRCFIHYQPTYYHFHVHIVNVDMEGVGALVGQAHLLDDVIDNLETFGSDYYRRKTLHYTLGAEHGLYKLFTA